ncbi:MCE family protein [Actinocorallia aurantiaca]|uniref:MlaD family protein n=1 Tax=Actinocorallia aurantiaca TaxID=46204 RepID=A0ABP6GXI9_9ACTN
MQRRILLNLGAFAVLGVVLCVWALTSIVSVDAIRRPFTVEAEFASSPGLRSDLEVAYLGVRIGSVDTVRLTGGKVVVAMHMDRGVVVPSNAKAAVLRKSAVGEPYIELEPDAAPAARPLREGDRIPIERTSVAVDYKRLFESVGGLLEAVRPEDANTLLHELAVGLEGRDDTLRDMLGDANQLTGTLADNAELLDELSVRLTELGGILADGGPQLANGLDGIAAFSDELAARRGDLDSILNRGPQFLDNTVQMIEAAKPGIGCLLSALGTPAPSVFTPKASSQISQALGLLHQKMPKIVDDVIVKEPSGNHYVRVTMAITAGGPVPVAREFTEPRPKPSVPQLYYCTKAYQKTADIEREAGRTRPENAQKPAEKAGPFTKVEAPVTDAAPASDSSPLGRWLPVVPIVLAAVILALTARRSLRLVRRRAGR